MANEFKVKKGLIVDGSNTVLDIQGTQGQLFSVTDSLVGDLFSISDISGIPIFNVNSGGLSTFDGDLTIVGNVTNRLKLSRAPGANNTDPTLAFGDGNTGFYERSDNDLRVAIGGVNYWEFSSNCMGNVNEGKAHLNSETATATNPSIIPWRNDSDTGIGRSSANVLSLIAGGTESLSLSATAATFVSNLGIGGAPANASHGSIGTKLDMKGGPDSIIILRGAAGGTSPNDWAASEYGLYAYDGEFSLTRTNVSSWWTAPDFKLSGGLATFASRVGIGVTASSNAMLDVKGPDTDDAVLGRFYSNTGSRGSFIIRNGEATSPTTFIGTAGGSEELSIGTNNTEAIRINASQYATFKDGLSIQSDSDNRFLVRSNDYTISRIISRGLTGTNLDMGLFSLMSSDGTNNNIEKVRIDSAGGSWFNGGSVSFGGDIDAGAAGKLAFLGSSGNPSLLIKNNTATSNAAGTATLKFNQALTQAGGKIVSGRDSNYADGASRDSNLKFYTSTNATDTLVLTLDSDNAATFAGDIKTTANLVPVSNGTGDFGTSSNRYASMFINGISVGTVTPTTIELQGSLKILNKAQTAYIALATRNTSGSEAVYDLSNLGNVASVTANFGDNVYMLGGQLYLNADDSSTDDSYRMYAASGQFVLASRESGTWTTRFDIDTSGNATFEGEITAGDDINASTKIVVGESATPEVRLKKTNTGNGKLSFYNNDDTSSTQQAYLSLDASEDFVMYSAANNDNVFYAGGALNLTMSSANATFAGSITGAQDFKATGSNMKLHAGGNHIINMDLNGNFYPQTHNSVDLGFSSTLAFRELYLSGHTYSGAGATYTGDLTIAGDGGNGTSRILVQNTNGSASNVGYGVRHQRAVNSETISGSSTHTGTYGWYTIKIPSGYSNQGLGSDIEFTLRTGGRHHNGKTLQKYIINVGNGTTASIGNFNSINILKTIDSRILISGYGGNATEALFYYRNNAANNTGEVIIRVYRADREPKSVAEIKPLGAWSSNTTTYAPQLVSHGYATTSVVESRPTQTRPIAAEYLTAIVVQKCAWVQTTTENGKFDLATNGTTNGGAQEIARFVNQGSGATSGYIYIGASSGTDWRLGKNVMGTSGNNNFGIAKHSGTIFSMEIDGSHNVAIGGSTPTSISANTSSLSVNSTRTDLSGALINKSNSTVRHQQYWDSSGYGFNLTASSGDFRWKVGGVERMTVPATGGLDIQGTVGQLFSVTNSLVGDIFSVADVSGIPIFNVNSSGLSNFDGDVLVGKTTVDNALVGVQLMTDGSVNPTVSGDTVARFNRLTNDGEVIRIQKNTATVGAIGCYNGVPYIGYTGSGGGGIMFNGLQVEPTAVGTSRTNNTNDLGSTNYKWRNGYFGTAVNTHNLLVANSTVVSGPGSGTSTVLKVNHGAGSHTGIGIDIQSANSGHAINLTGTVGGNYARLTSAYNNAPDFFTSGTITAGQDVIAYSDAKLKENIKTLDGSKVLKMRGVSFDRIDTGLPSSGVIAQEIQEVAPELVNEIDGTLGVSYGNLVGYLIEAVKDQQKQIDELKKLIK